MDRPEPESSGTAVRPVRSPRPVRQARQNKSGFSWSFLPFSFYPHPCRLRNSLPPRTIPLAACRAGQPHGIRNFCRLCCSVGWATGRLSEQRRPSMAYVIAEPCIGTKDTACVDVCPVDCIHPRKDEPEFEGETQLYINPTECIDCGASVPVCPVTAISPLKHLPTNRHTYTPAHPTH